MTTKAHPNTTRRSEQEKTGGCWLPLYIEAEKCVVSGATCRCFYCGFGVNEGHDFACLYLTTPSFPVPQKFSGKDTVIFVPKGGLPQPTGVPMF